MQLPRTNYQNNDHLERRSLIRGNAVLCGKGDGPPLKQLPRHVVFDMFQDRVQHMFYFFCDLCGSFCFGRIFSHSSRQDELQSQHAHD